MAADISPIETLGYRPTHKTVKERKAGKGKVIARLSMEQFTKDKKRTAVVLLSLAASLSVYLCIVTMLDSQAARLAVACGISREYYNRIEKGKQPLNDELREVIEKQIERFNQQEPLFLLIDYFRVRFPTTDALAIIRDVLQLKADYMLYEDYGKYGYESKYVLGNINIMCSMQEHLGVLLELKGKGCRQMECYLLAQERSWYDFILDCMTAGGVMKRLDLAINDKAGILDIPKLKEKYKAGECISYFRMQKDYSGTEKL